MQTTEMTAIETASVQQTQADHSDRTSGIGTSLYIAPEVAISRFYNEKVERLLRDGSVMTISRPTCTRLA